VYKRQGRERAVEVADMPPPKPRKVKLSPVWAKSFNEEHDRLLAADPASDREIATACALPVGASDGTEGEAHWLGVFR